MENPFKYTVGANTDTPIMFIDAQIGQSFNKDGNWDGEPFIDGAIFAKELMELDIQNKSHIDIWICSEGGNIMQAQKIYSAILNSKTKVNTYNMGGCFSIAASLFQAGRKRYMADYSKLMLHPVQGASDNKAYQSFTDSVATMLSRRTNKSEGEIKQMMNSTTWLNAEQCLELGLCDEIVFSDSKNKPRIDAGLKEAVQFANKLIENQQKPINQSMKKVTNKLSLNEAASEDSIFEAIVAMENKYKAENSSLSAIIKDTVSKSENAASQLTALQGKFDAMEAENKVRLENENKAKATNLIASAVKDGKIANEPAAIAEWTELATLNYEGTEKLVNTLVVSKAGKKIEINGAVNKADVGAGASMAEAMAKIANKAKANQN